MNRGDSYYLGNKHEPFVQSGGPAARELDIRIQAYRLWDAAGRPVDRDWEFWFKAEKQFEDMVGGW
jgi:hypothetical protein